MRPSGCDWKQLQRGTTAKKNFRGGALHPWKREPLLTILNSFPVEGLKVLVRRYRCPLLSTRVSLQKLPFCWKRERERVEKKKLKRWSFAHMNKGIFINNFKRFSSWRLEGTCEKIQVPLAFHKNITSKIAILLRERERERFSWSCISPILPFAIWPS